MTRSMHRKPKRIKKKKSIFKNKFFWIFLFAVVFAFSGFYVVAFLDAFQVKTVQVKENDAKLKKNVEALANRSIERKMFFLSTRSIFILDSASMRAAVLHAFPEIETVQIKRRLPNSLIITPHKREEVALWCKTQDECFALDSKGILFGAKKPKDEFRIFGELAIDESMISSLLAFKQKANMKFVSAVVVSSSQIQYKTFEGWEAYVDPKEDINWQATKLQTVLQKKNPVDTAALEYIDLRFGNQAYLKYRTLLR